MLSSWSCGTATNASRRVGIWTPIRRRFLSANAPFRNVPSLKDFRAFEKLMNYRPQSVLTNEISDLDKYNIDWTKRYHGHSSVVLRPQSTQEMSSILAYCHDLRLGVVPQAGNTGLVGGSIPVNDEVIISVERLNKIYELEETNGIIKCEAGCVLQDLQDYAATMNHMIPVDLGSKGSCQIGGNVSTNAGGSYYARYGSIHANVVGLEAVTANGNVLDLGFSTANLKDNTGYDLKHLFIGAEGTLGIITKVALHCPRLPSSRHVAFVACTSYEAVLRTLTMAKDVLGEVLAAFEFMDRDIMELIRDAGSKRFPVIQPNGDCYSYCILVETHGSHREHDAQKMEQFLEHAMENECIVDGVLSKDLTEVHNLWEIRELANPTAARSGYTYKYDISLPVSQFSSFIDEMRSHINNGYNGYNTKNPNWGHIMDGNLHFNVTTPGHHKSDPDLLNVIQTHILDAVIRRKGSMSAEHGLGQSKHVYLPRIKDPAVLSMFYSIKHLFDPHGILNPGKYLPEPADD